MNKFKQSAYTFLLLATCFIASPLILRQIWETSDFTHKNKQVPPLVVTKEEKKTADSSKRKSVQEHTMGPVEIADDNTGDDPQPTYASIAETEMPETAEPGIFVTSDASYFDDVLFIGDSRTVGLKEYGSFKNSTFFCEPGFSAGTINDAKVDGKSLDETLSEKQYGKVYIMLGINEVSNDFEFTLSAYRSLIDKVKEKQPDSLIFLQANLHVSVSAESKTITNTGIDALNSAISSFADDKKTFYIDINELYDDENGALNSGYTSDGIHPIAMYYTQWCEWLCTKTVPVPEPETTAPATSADTIVSSTETSTETSVASSTETTSST